MATTAIGDAEKRFIIHGVQDDLRCDGRGCEDYRHLEMEVGLISNTHGSSRLRIGNTELLVGIKVELEKPSPNLPNQGVVEFNVDCSPNATPQFQGRGGDDLSAIIKSLLTRAYKNRLAVNLEKLCVIPKRNCWALYVDVLILECGGNLLDAVSIGVLAALSNTTIPKLTVRAGDEGEAEINLPDDPLDAEPLDTSHCPIFVTLCKVGHRHIVDATAEEEACCLARMVLAITRDGKVMAVRKDGSGSLDPESINEMIETGNKVGKQLHRSVLKFINSTSTKEKTGFL